MLAIIGFALMIILMFVLIKEKMAPPLAFILLPLIAAVVALSLIHISEPTRHCAVSRMPSSA